MQNDIGPSGGRVAYISSSPIPSTQANSVHVMCMAEALVQEGYRAELIARLSGELPGVDDYFAFYGIEPVFGLTRLRRVRGLNALYARKAAAFVRKLKPDVVYGRDLHAVGLCARDGFPVVLESHGPMPGLWARARLGRLAASGRLRRVVVISEALKALVLEKHGSLLAEELVTVAHDGVDLERFADLPGKSAARAEVGLESEGFVAGYFGHLYAGRGVEILLAAARRIPEMTFLLVGGRPEDVVALRNRAGDLGNVRVTGHVPRGRLRPYWSACDALLMPYQRKVAVKGGGDTSAWMSPMKMFEYMACCRAIVSSDLPVLREVLGDGRSSLLVAPESVDAWVGALERLRTNPDLADRLASRAREDAEDYSWRARVRCVMDGIL